MNRIRIPIRRKLLIATLAPLLLALAACWLIGARLITGKIEQQALSTVRTNLSAAREIYDSELLHLLEKARFVGRTPAVAAALTAGNEAELFRIATLIAGVDNLGFMALVDRYGMVRCRVSNPDATGDSLRHFRVVAEALQGRPSQGTMLLNSQQSETENPTLAGRMQTRLRPTPNARPAPMTSELRGLFHVAAAPLLDQNGVVVGAVFTGHLLNGDEQLVDRITRIIFESGNDPNLRQGNATIFLNDLRIATTVPDDSGQRAIGTRLSSEVAKTVLENGQVWVKRAFVFNEWNFSAYEPLRDPEGNIIGALYVGMPERPYVELRRKLNLLFGLVIAVVTLLALALGSTISGRIARPVRVLAEGARRLAAGEKIPPIEAGTGDEIALLAEEFNNMATRLTAREEEIVSLNRTLEQKVVQRTSELEEKSRQLLETEKELARNERMAEMGMLSAGVAHEINNPLAIIRGNAELLQMSVPQESDNQEEISEILTQAGRINRIVESLLTLARQERRQISRFELAPLVDEIINGIRHQTGLEGIELVLPAPDNRIQLEGDRDQLRQVFTNLVLNALQAMGGVGTLSITADSEATGYCRITFADSGPGIAPEHQERLFTPFFSTKQNGTGLGLAVSWGIVRNHGGTIEVQSAPGSGARFVVTLPG